ncbi:hypothetical protein [Thermococcus aciditolerans]|uniref:Uncharacterized protein n=1 Tax=Thermococcus aciditolerans TaxID=2598455 RepID=A0A5C0SQ89_9EURY|nr:hypothetical protein [Thermococcus aciditolerans]QEK15358.1 hypothetical protein FPV09_09945 [Thermococcus aciditolerans]
MKGKALLLVLLLLGAYAYVNGYLSPEDVHSTVDRLSGERNGSGVSGSYSSTIPGNVSVSGANGSVYVRFDAPAINENLPGLLYTLAEENNATIVDAYYLGEPVLRLTLENGSAFFEDIRTPEFRIRSDLGLFDVNIVDVSATNETAAVTLEYLADGEGFWKDYFAMAFVVLEDAPWVETVSITYLTENGTVTLSMSSEDIIRLQSGEVTSEELPGLVTVSKTEGR